MGLDFTQSQFCTVGVHVTELHGVIFSLAAGFDVAGGKTQDTVLPQAAMQAQAGQLRTALVQAPHHIDKRQYRSSSELPYDGLFGRRKGCAAGPRWPHGQVSSGGAGSPLVNGCAAQAVSLGRGTGRFFRPLEFGTNSRRNLRRRFRDAMQQFIGSDPA